ncbi:guanylate kinase [Chondromyces crocatus]|uniref:Guanylate kinase n=1 Tax=Chondromyces crocatus TaxID=52 RepID=A0A0K1EJR4_CHOCO|nr:guanylate kinase [Chondromyces crocatus]AKT40843.1 guanylate kinase [Chondromyces crocatus]
MSSEAADDDFLLLIVSSPSGAGKTTLCSRLRSEFPELRFSVSHTTRKPRPNEVDGREYHFVDTPTFEQMVRGNAFAEWARVHGHLYGTSLKEIELARTTARGILFDIDYQGARQIRAALDEAVCVFILPPTMAELERRLRGRGTEDEQATLRRLQNARGEIEHYGFFDYVIVNDEVDRAYDQLRAVVFAERCRRRRRARMCERLLTERRSER